MKTYSKFVYRSFIGPFLATFCIALFILLMQFIWLYVDDLIGKGLGTFVVAKLLLFVSASLVPMALPLAMLLSSLMTFGNLGENYELVAFKASGIPLKRVMRPLIFLAALISIGAFVFSNNVIPIANLKMKSLLYDISKQKPTINIKSNVFYGGINGFTIRVKDKTITDKGTILHDIMIYDEREGKGNRKIIIAKWGKMSIGKKQLYAVMELHDGHSYFSEESKNQRNPNHPFYRRSFKESRILFNISGFKLHRTDENLFKDNYQMMNVHQLSNSIDTIVHYKQQRLASNLNTIQNKYLIFYQNNKQRNTLRDSSVQLPYEKKYKQEKYANKPINFDHFLSQIPEKQRGKVLSMAITLSRSNANICNVLGIGEDNRIQSIVKRKIEINKKFSLSAACLILFFIGAPLGAIIRKGGLGMPILISAVLFVLYYIISISGERMSEELILSPWLGTWLSGIAFLPLGIWLTYKATKDSQIFNLDSYFIVFDKIAQLFKKRNKS